MKSQLALVVLLFGTACQALAVSQPVFSNQYILSGRILLPYAEIDEPFKAYYDEVANKSRVDYYGDLEQTVQRPDQSQSYKIAYMVNTQGQPSKVCFNMGGSELAPTTVTSALPDLTPFSLKRKNACKDLGYKSLENVEGSCEEWQYLNSVGEKDNKYVFVLTKNDQGQSVPLYYLMMGYDSLLGSHYDKYEVIYETYQVGPVDSKVFDIIDGYKCVNFPGPGNTVATMNPIKEFVHNDRSHIDDGFDQFTKQHRKDYNELSEWAQRKVNFMNNYRYIMSFNRMNQPFKLALNHMADYSKTEMDQLKGKQNSNTTFNGGLTFDKSQYDASKLPAQWDWRLLGAVTPVKDQAICGSCWSFGTTGTLEGAYFLKTGKLLKLSQQQLIDCSWNQQNNGCDGGEDFRSYDYILQAGGLSTEEEYGHYLGVDGKCHDRAVNKPVRISGFYNVTKGDAQAMKLALFNHGPVTIAINASLRSFSFYSHGIYYDKACDPNNLDHQVLAVGYGELNGQKYWLVKNSWSTYWGNDGYVLINQKDNNCGVLSDGTFPIIA